MNQVHCFKEETMEPKNEKNKEKMETNLFNPMTVLECDINAMTLKDFLAFCKTEYLKAHNIQDNSKELKVKKQNEETFTEEIQEIAGKASECYMFKELTFRYAMKELTNICNRITEHITAEENNKPGNLAEKNKAFRNVSNKIKNYLKDNNEKFINWSKETESYDEKDTITIKTVKAYIQECLNETCSEKTEEKFIRLLVKLIKRTQPVKVIVTEKAEKRKRREYYSRTFIKEEINVIVSLAKENNKAEK